MTIKFVLSAALLWASLVFNETDAAEPLARIVTLGGSVTEIVYALGAEKNLVGTDQSSLYPEAAQQLASVGYYRQLPLEGVVSLKPTQVIASEHAGPARVIAALQAMKINVVQVTDKPTLDSLRERVRQIALAVDRVPQGEVLLQQFELLLSQAQEKEQEKVQDKVQDNAHLGMPLKAVTVVLRAGKILGAGSNTAAGVVLQQAGLVNALSDQDGYRPLSAESMSAIAPEVIVVTRSTVTSMGSLESVKNSPILKHTPAVKNNRVLVLDDLLVQGFGLRLPLAVSEIRQALDGTGQPE